MNPYVNDPDFALYVGDATETLRELPDESVHMCVTSPPFYGLRDYGVEGQIGLENSPEEWVERLVEVFREVRRVLRKDGTLWLEVGDSYAGSWGAQGRRERNVDNPRHGLSGRQIAAHPASETRTGSIPPNSLGLKPKDLVGGPWLLALALRADGWFLRGDIIWNRPNPMPESIRDRPTKAHSYVFLLAKSGTYYYDQEAVREPYNWPEDAWLTPDGWAPEGSHDPISHSRRGPDGRKKTTVEGGDGSIQHRDGERWPNPAGRNVRSVWTIATEGFSGAHFATFPQALAERCIKAGTSERGCCPGCGVPWKRITDVAYEKSPGHGEGSVVVRHDASGQNNYDGAGMPRRNKVVTTTGWQPSCSCITSGELDWHSTKSVAPCVVLDPFLGSGTTALVARRHGRKCIGIELSLEYAALAARRLSQLSLLAEPA